MRRRGRGIALLVVVVSATVLSGCGDAIGMPESATDESRTVGRVFDLYLAVAAVVGLVVVGLILVVLVRDRRSRKGDGLGSQRHHNTPLEIAYTVIPLLIVGALTVVTLATIGHVASDSPDPDVVVDVQGFQWGWRFTYVNRGVVVVTAGDGAPPELVLPEPATVRFDLHSSDVIHSFYVPAFRFKRDLIPGTPTSFSVKTVEAGTYDGHCAEFCGLLHAQMSFTVRTVASADFKTWLASRGPQG